MALIILKELAVVAGGYFWLDRHLRLDSVSLNDDKVVSDFDEGRDDELGDIIWHRQNYASLQLCIDAFDKKTAEHIDLFLERLSCLVTLEKRLDALDD